jgi:pilus assembly protein CpaB
MNRTRLLMIGTLALAAGLVASYMVYGRLRAAPGAGNEPGVEVVVAANDLVVGKKVEERDVLRVRYPQNNLPVGIFTNPSQVVGRGVVLPVNKGEFLLPSKLAPVNGGTGLTSLIPPGMRAVSVRVNDVVSVAGFVQPGSRVDVLLTGGSGAERQTTTVLTNVAVIAVGKNLERSATGETQAAPVITLLVSPDDAQKLALAGSEGRIQLALRNPLDTRQPEIAATRESSLYPGGKPSVAAPPKAVIRKATATHAPTPPQTYSVELIRGSKRDETKF